MLTLKYIYLFPIFWVFVLKSVHLTDVTLDLDQTDSDDKFDVVHSQHYGIDSTEFYVKKGFKTVSVVQGQLQVWKQQTTENATDAILYFPKQALSLLYLRVVADSTPLQKYYVKVNGTWREVLEVILDSFMRIDRSKFKEENLNMFAEDYINRVTNELVNVRLFLPKSFHFVVEPVYDVHLEILNPNTSFIMEQFRLGSTFGKVFTPRLDFAITQVSYASNVLWSSGSEYNLCSSVWTYFKGQFDHLISIVLYNFDSGLSPTLNFRKTKHAIIQISGNEFETLLNKMALAEYDRKDIECYRNGFLKARDFAHVITTLFAFIITISSIWYNI